MQRLTVGLLLLLLAACGAGPPTGTDVAVRTVRDVEYRPGWAMDVSRPATGTGLPVAVLLHGCCGDRSDLTLLARAIADTGVVTVNADWGGLSAGGFPSGVSRAACALVAGRDAAVEHGGDPSRLVLVGWSDGAMVAALVALGAVGCPGAPAAPPPALLTIGGWFGWPGPAPVQRDARAEAWFGGPQADVPDAWAAGNPYRALGGGRGLRAHLLVGEQDPVAPESERFAAALEAAGAQVRLSVLPYAGDQTLLSARTEEGRTVVRAVRELLDRS